MSEQVNQTENNGGDGKPLTFAQVTASVLWAFLGVQSDKNRLRDFKQGKLSHFIWLGLIFALFFVLIVFGLVKTVLYFAGIQ